MAVLKSGQLIESTTEGALYYFLHPGKIH